MIIAVITRWFLVAAGVIVAAYIIPGITVASFYIALIVAALLGIVNIFIRPVLFVLTLPLTVITLGLFAFVINGLLLWFLASFIEGFAIAGLLSAIIGSVIVSVISSIGEKILLHNHE